MDAEHRRLEETRSGSAPWRKWGPYLSGRQWGAVREVERLFGTPNRTPYVKDGIGSHLVHGRREAVNPERTGTKASARYTITVDAGKSKALRLRLTDAAPAAQFGSAFDAGGVTRRNGPGGRVATQTGGDE